MKNMVQTHVIEGLNTNICKTEGEVQFIPSTDTLQPTKREVKHSSIHKKEEDSETNFYIS